MPQAATNTVQLDEHLMAVVRALQGAVKQGVAHKDDTRVMDRAIADCKEILDEVMKGDVKAWLN